MSVAALLARRHADKEAFKYTDLKPLAVLDFLPAAKWPNMSAALRANSIATAKATPQTALQTALQSAPHSAVEEAQNLFSSDKSAHPAKAEANRLVFVNGSYVPELSSFRTDISEIFTQENDTDYKLVLAEQTCLVFSPIELCFVSLSAAPPNASECGTNLKIHLGESGRLTLIERHIGLEENQLSPAHSTPAAFNAKLNDILSGSTQPELQPAAQTPANTTGNAGPMPIRHAHFHSIDISLAPQAKLVHGRILAAPAHAAHFGQISVTAAKGAFYDNFTLITGGAIIRNEISVSLEGTLAQSCLNGLMLLEGHSHADTATQLKHTVADSTSRQIYKAVLGDASHGVFQGRVIVDQAAQKTDAHQLCRALLLSDRAEMDTKPELEIYADDVKCSHGCSIGELEPEALFYMRSRGIAPAQARALLISAFVNEMIDGISAPELRQAVQNSVASWLAQK